MGSASENSNPFRISPQFFRPHQSQETSDDSSTRETSGFNSPNRNPFHEDDSNWYVFKYANKI
jgi:hypothetical protein